VLSYLRTLTTWRCPHSPGACRCMASWTENVQGQKTYVMLNAASKLKVEKDWMKPTAQSTRSIRENFRQDWMSKEMKLRQRTVDRYLVSAGPTAAGLLLCFGPMLRLRDGQTDTIT